ncbi:MAG: cytochrome b/b6 domain-containing protein [Acidimicrobiales bacterium]
MVEATRPRSEAAAKAGAGAPDAAPTIRPAASDPAPKARVSGPPLSRFDSAERVVHWVNASLFAIVMATALALYIPPLSAVVGRRELVVTIHVYAGLLLPFPLLLGIAGSRWGRRLRSDLRRLNRWIPEDRVWMRRRAWKAERAVGIKQGKFNAGQKLNAAFTGGAIVVMVATGSIMHWFNHFPLSWRTGATFVHDWVFIALFLTITGHVMFALKDRDSMNSMMTGSISRTWAKRHAPLWLDEIRTAERQSSKKKDPAGDKATI